MFTWSDWNGILSNRDCRYEHEFLLVHEASNKGDVDTWHTRARALLLDPYLQLYYGKPITQSLYTASKPYGDRTILLTIVIHYEPDPCTTIDEATELVHELEATAAVEDTPNDVNTAALREVNFTREGILQRGR